MLDSELARALTSPRPSGSQAERETLAAVCAWCEARDIPFTLHAFTLRPWFNECVGTWLIASRATLAFAAARRWGWRTLPLALVAQAGGLADVAGLPLVTWPGARRAANVIITFGPPAPEREIILAAHYDSKTELLDHRGRRFFTRRIRLGSFLTLAAGLLAAAEGMARARASRFVPQLHTLALLCALPMLALGAGLGLNLALGRLGRQSSGAVDNGGACMALLALAERLARSEISLGRTRVTIALFGGEEVNMQGSAAYVAERFPAPINAQRPTVAVNLELLGQRGGFVIWERDGNALRTLPASAEVRALLTDSVRAVTGSEPASEPLLNSDAHSFLAAGVPCAVLGSRDPVQGVGGIHRPDDSPARIDAAAIAKSVRVLMDVVRRYEVG